MNVRELYSLVGTDKMTEDLGQPTYTMNPAAETMKVELDEPVLTRDDRVSLYGLAPHDALRALLSTPPEPKND